MSIHMSESVSYYFVSCIRTHTCIHAYMHTHIRQNSKDICVMYMAALYACIHVYYAYIHTYIHVICRIPPSASLPVAAPATGICMNKYIYVCMYVCIHTYTHTHKYSSFMHVCVCVCAYIYIYIYIHVRTYTYIHTCAYVCIQYTNIHRYICLKSNTHTCISKAMFIHM